MKNYSEDQFDPLYQKVDDSSKKIHIVGMVLLGFFTLICLKLGFKPIVFERGKDVRSRRRDIALLSREGVVDSESNYCYGEGGAGTFSDGKLYSWAKKETLLKY